MTGPSREGAASPPRHPHQLLPPHSLTGQAQNRTCPVLQMRKQRPPFSQPTMRGSDQMGCFSRFLIQEPRSGHISRRSTAVTRMNSQRCLRSRTTRPSQKVRGHVWPETRGGIMKRTVVTIDRGSCGVRNLSFGSCKGALTSFSFQMGKLRPREVEAPF